MKPAEPRSLVEENGRLVIPTSGAEVDDELVRALRDADREGRPAALEVEAVVDVPSRERSSQL
jgi:hypothetical protein